MTIRITILVMDLSLESRVLQIRKIVSYHFRDVYQETLDKFMNEIQYTTSNIKLPNAVNKCLFDMEYNKIESKIYINRLSGLPYVLQIPDGIKSVEFTLSFTCKNIDEVILPDSVIELIIRNIELDKIQLSNNIEIINMRYYLGMNDYKYNNIVLPKSTKKIYMSILNKKIFDHITFNDRVNIILEGFDEQIRESLIYKKIQENKKFNLLSIEKLNRINYKYIYEYQENETGRFTKVAVRNKKYD